MQFIKRIVNGRQSDWLALDSSVLTLFSITLIIRRVTQKLTLNLPLSVNNEQFHVFSSFLFDCF